MTTFTEVTNFTDFLEAFLNKYFRFTRHVAQASPNVTQVRIGRVTYIYLKVTLGSGLGNIFGWVSHSYQLTGYVLTGSNDSNLLFIFPVH